MQTFRTATRIERAGELHLDHVPFAKGEEVADSRVPLRGRPVRYDDPFKPIAEEDWKSFGDPRFGNALAFQGGLEAAQDVPPGRLARLT